MGSQIIKQVDPFYLSKEWEKVRTLAIKRDGYTCQLCGVKCLGRKRNKPSPHVDHIQPLKDNPELALELSNLRTLCGSCHSSITLKARHAQNKIQIGVDGYPIESA